MPSTWKNLLMLRALASPAWGVFAVGAAITALAFATAESRVQQHAILKADTAINDAREAIQARLHTSSEVIYGAQGLFRASDSVTREDFQQYVSGLHLAERHPGIRLVTYAAFVPGRSKAAVEAWARGDSRVHANVFSRFRIRPEGDRPEYVPIVFLEPLADNENGIGLDLLTGERRESVERARDTGMATFSGRIPLSAHPDAPAFSVRLALYHNHMPTRTPEERRAAFKGVISTTFLAADLVGDILTHPALGPMAVAFYDRVAIAGGEALGAGSVDYTLFAKAGTAVSETDHGYFSRHLALDVGGRDWYLKFAGSARDFMTPTDSALPWILLVAGLLVSALLASLVHSLASSRSRAHRLAAQITEDLRRSEGKLAEAQQLTQAMLEALPNPIFFKGTDGRYSGVNQAWEKFFGISRDTFLGKTVHDLYPHDAAVADRMHARDQALWAQPGSQAYEAVIPAADGTRHDVVYYKATYARTDGAVAGIVGTIVDMTERKQAERQQKMEHAITRVLAEAGTLAVAIPQIIQTMCEAMGWDYGDHYEYEEELGVLRQGEVWTIGTPEMRAFAASVAQRTVKPDTMGSGLVRRAYAAAKPIWISDISKDERLRRKELIAQAGLHSAFAFPLVANGNVLGVMEFFHRDVLESDETLIRIAESIGSQIGQFIVRMRAEEAVKFVAMHDSLTGLPNRLMFNQRLEQAIAQARRRDKSVAVMFIDLDRFKIINDTLGHETGDLLLREVAQRITEHLRTGDIVARLGGDEFVVLLEDVEDAAAVATVAEKLIAALTSNFVISGREVHVSASIGVSTYPLDAQDMRSLMKFADIAMYRAKEQGRNTFQFYSDQINVHSVERLTLESQLRGALERNELVLHYQPVMDAQTGGIVGVEALVRWQHPEAGLLPPGKFISIAEETGLIVPIGAWVLQAACSQQRKWKELGLPPLRMAVNLSPRQFAHRHLVQDIVHALSQTSCDSRFLELEITESTVMHNAPRAVALLTELKEMGVRIAIDDFGTGYSSLAYLKRFPIDSLKIDRSFVTDVPGDASASAITTAIIAMAHTLDLKVIAEGVETPEQLAFLREHGCDNVQGYYFNAPLPEEQVTALLKDAHALQQAANVAVLDSARRLSKAQR